MGKSVGMAANEMVIECNKQFDQMFDVPQVISDFRGKVDGLPEDERAKFAEIAERKYTDAMAISVLDDLTLFAQRNGLTWPLPSPDYATCIQISTDASLKEMILPGALVIFSPLVAGFGFGKNACAGMLSGAMVSAVQLAIHEQQWRSMGQFQEVDQCWGSRR